MHNVDRYLQTAFLALSVLVGACTVAPQDDSVTSGLSSQSLTGVGNVYGAVYSGTAPPNGGLDGHGYAYAARLLGSSVTFAGTTFAIGAEDTLNAVSNKKISVAAGPYASLNIVGTGCNGAQTEQSFVVTYSDGTTSTFAQSLSDWGAPESSTGETNVLTMTARITPAGVAQQGAWHLYGYTFALNSAKTVESITLPANRDVIVFGIGFTSPVVTTPVEPAAAVKGGYSSLVLDSTFTSTAKIDLNDTKAAGFDWYMTNPAWSSDVSPASKFTIVNNAGTSALRIDGTGDGYSLYGALKVKGGVVGHQFTGGAYYEARLAMERPIVVSGAAHTNGGAAAWPAFWATPSLGTGSNYQWPGAPTGYDNSVEMDIMEFMPEAVNGLAAATASFTAHDWYGLYDVTCKGYCQTMNSATGEPDAYSLKTSETSALKLQTLPTDSTPTFHNYGVLIMPSVADASGNYVEGYVQYYFDDVAQGSGKYFAGPLPDTSAASNDFTPTPTAYWTYLPIQLQPYGFILCAGGNAFMQVEYVRVWQK